MPVDFPISDEYPYDKCNGDAESAYCNRGFDTAGKILSHLYTNIGVGALADKDNTWKTQGVLR
jgi:hypothetical protein